MPPSRKPLSGQALINQRTKTSSAPPAPKGNTRATRSGINTETRLGPVRQRHLTAIEGRFPDLDELRAVILADRMARIELAMAWLDQQPRGIVRNRDGDVYAVVKELDKWQGRVEQILKEAEEQRAKPKRVDLALQMAELAAEEAGG